MRHFSVKCGSGTNGAPAKYRAMPTNHNIGIRSIQRMTPSSKPLFSVMKTGSNTMTPTHKRHLFIFGSNALVAMRPWKSTNLTKKAPEGAFFQVAELPQIRPP
jgi:hypothetical protein